MAGSGTGQSRQRLVVLIGALLVCLAAIWHFARGGDEPPAPPPVAEDEPAPATAPAPAPAPPRRTPEPAQPPAPDPEEVITSDGIPIAPPRGEVIGPHHPHPITPQHLRIFGENRLIGAIEGAMEIKDTAGMRRLLEKYRREYPEDDQEAQDGYAIIADCIDHRDAATRAAAERWLDSHNGSSVKRYVLRHCVEPPPPQ
ncbi:MAG TPA: hypothetical protein VKQ32_29635 [Polyangia bacterium]|nr:hypothetical protein [Polyangia bacterium]